MKKALKILGIIIGCVALLLMVTGIWIQTSSLPVYEVSPLPIQVNYDSAQVHQGRKIVETICWTCHQGEDGTLSGRLFSPPDGDFGEIWSANITRHPEYGLGTYSDDELAFTLRTGINRNGRFLGPFMLFPNLSDKDLAAVIAYLRSESSITASSAAQHPAPDYSFLAKALLKLGAMQPLSPPESSKVHPPPSDKIAYGRYLATSVYECSNCHSKNFMTNDLLDPEQSEGFFGGGNPIETKDFDVVVSPNLTPDPVDGLGAWSKEQFAQAVRKGRTIDDTVLHEVMPRFSLLTDEEIDAIWTYLQSIPVLKAQETVAAN